MAHVLLLQGDRGGSAVLHADTPISEVSFSSPMLDGTLARWCETATDPRGEPAAFLG